MSYSQDQLDLLAYIQLENEKFVSEAKESGATMIMTATDDLDHWESIGVRTIEEYIRSGLLGEISDAEKELFGIRTRNDYSKATNDQLQAILDDLRKSIKQEYLHEIEQEREHERKRIEIQKRNKYHPNLVFENLKEMLNNG